MLNPNSHVQSSPKAGFRSQQLTPMSAADSTKFASCISIELETLGLNCVTLEESIVLMYYSAPFQYQTDTA